ncbi:MAG TPA: bifunctional diguanylate cyclase/phosphodiesterase [Longimicrobiales bacterium]|nr:bifunctional diguanylate cyclase/phosphodiesterase [Longimicrobiales bacterium]
MQNVRHSGVVRRPLPATEARALLRDPAGHDVFARAARLAAQALRSPMAVVAAAEGSDLALVARAGVPAPWSLVQDVLRRGVSDTAIAGAGEPFIALSAPADGRRLTFCGVPIAVDGTVVAILATGDAEPRQWMADDAAMLRDLAAMLLRELGQEAAAAAAAHPPVAAHGAPAPATGPALSAELPTAPGRHEVRDGLVMLDGSWRVAMLNSRASELLDLGDTDPVNQVLWDVCPALAGTSFHRECVQSERAPREAEEEIASRGGWVEIRSWPADNGDTVLYVRDVTRRRSEQDALRAREARYRQLFEESGSALFAMDPVGTLLDVNEALVQLLGRAREDLQGSTLMELALDGDAAAGLLDSIAQDGAVTDRELRFRRGAGEEIVVAVSGHAPEFADGGDFHGSMRDVTEQRRNGSAGSREAGRGERTGLANRTVFLERLEEVMHQSRRRAGDRYAVLFIDLDDFKAINDDYGDRAGDRILDEVGRRLQSCVREDDLVARIGGDEFGVLLDTIQGGVSVTLVVDRIRESLRQPFDDNRCPAGVTASIGIAMSGGAHESAEELVRDADTAMYRAKHAGRNECVVFDTDLQDSALLQRQLEDDLRGAIDAGQLSLVYHPVLDLRAGTLTGLEALVRWTHPRHGVLLPGEFMPLAEQSELGADIGWWVLREACRQMQEWQLAFPRGLPMVLGVNVSSRQFSDPELLGRLSGILDETGLPAAQLRLEITEAVVTRDPARAGTVLTGLHERGVRVFIDDFGTGYSSLQQLRRFPVSGLKIHGSFVRQLGTSDAGAEMVQAILGLGRSMDIDTIAEGVETLDQLDRLRVMGARYAQGFLFSRPLDAAATRDMLKQTRA